MPRVQQAALYPPTSILFPFLRSFWFGLLFITTQPDTHSLSHTHTVLCYSTSVCVLRLSWLSLLLPARPAPCYAASLDNGAIHSHCSMSGSVHLLSKWPGAQPPAFSFSSFTQEIEGGSPYSLMRLSWLPLTLFHGSKEGCSINGSFNQAAFSWRPTIKMCCQELQPKQILTPLHYFYRCHFVPIYLYTYAII